MYQIRRVTSYICTLAFKWLIVIIKKLLNNKNSLYLINMYVFPSSNNQCSLQSVYRDTMMQGKLEILGNTKIMILLLYTKLTKLKKRKA